MQQQLCKKRISVDANGACTLLYYKLVEQVLLSEYCGEGEGEIITYGVCIEYFNEQDQLVIQNAVRLITHREDQIDDLIEQLAAAADDPYNLKDIVENYILL